MMIEAVLALEERRLASPRFSEIALPLQVAAVCYRRRGESVEFLLVNTNGGGKWTFPKGSTDPRLSHSQSAEREHKGRNYDLALEKYLCLLYTSPSPRDYAASRMPSSA